MTASVVDGGPWRGPSLSEWLRRIGDGADRINRPLRVTVVERVAEPVAPASLPVGRRLGR